MDSLLGINANTPLVSIGANRSITPTYGLLALELGLSTPGVFGGASTVVELSRLGQLLSATSTFQDKLRSLQPGTATSGGGKNFGTDFASLAAETQSLVDTFNGLQSTITNINGTSNLLGVSVTGASGLIQSLNTQAKAGYVNGNSALTKLSQLGIEFQPSLLPGGGGSLSINLSTLQSAFNADAASAFSLLSKAANAFSDLAGNFNIQAGSQYFSLAALTQTSAREASLTDILTNSLLSQAQFNGNLTSLLPSASLSGSASLQQVILAMNEYALVTGLLG